MVINIGLINITDELIHIDFKYNKFCTVSIISPIFIKNILIIF